MSSNRSKPNKPNHHKSSADDKRKLISAIHNHFGYIDGRCEPSKLWENRDGSMRYRINWWNWEYDKIIKSVFCHIKDINSEKPDDPPKDYEPQYEIKEVRKFT